MPVLAPAGEVLSLAPEKVPKERVQGEGPLDTPRSVGVRPSLSGVLDPRLRSFPRWPAALCVAYALVPAAQAGRLVRRGTSVCAPLEGQARRLEHQMQAPVDGAEVRQVWSAKGRGPPWVAEGVSRCAPVGRDWHLFYAPVKLGFLGGKPCVRGTPFVPS